MQHNGSGIDIEEEVQCHSVSLRKRRCCTDEWRTAYANTDENLADLLMKPLSGPKRAKFVRMVLHHVFPEKGNGDVGGD